MQIWNAGETRPRYLDGAGEANEVYFSIWRISSCIGAIAALQAIAAADDSAYVVDGNGYFQQIDLNTGTTSFIGDMGQVVGGLGEVDGVVYATSYFTSPELFWIDTTNGGLNSIGALSTGVAAFGSTTSGLYGIAQTNANGDLDLIKIDPTDGTETDIGDTGISTLSGSWQLSSAGSSLYFANEVGVGDDELYEVDTTTGAFDDLGDLGGADVIGAMTFVNGTFFAGEYGSPYSVYSVDENSLTATTLSNAQNVNSFWGMAPIANSSVPGPDSTLVAALGLAGAARRRRKSR